MVKVLILLVTIFLGLGLNFKTVQAKERCLGNQENSKNWNNCIGTYINKEKFEYEGSFKNGKFNGRGSLKTENYTYEGNFVDDYMNGYGVMKFANGGSYQGNFKKNLFQGLGKLFYADGSIYEGYFSDEVQNGYGILKLPNKLRYEGNWSKGKLKEGLLIDETGQILREGLFESFKLKKNNKFQSKEPLRLAFSKLKKNQRKEIQRILKKFDLYSQNIDGIWGRGTEKSLLLFANKQKFSELSVFAAANELLQRILIFQNVRDMSEIIQTLPKCSQYQNFKRCFDTVSFKNGEEYSGEFLEGQFHGKGQYIYADGSKYKGNFEKGVPEGQGIVSTKEGERVEGNFHKGLLNGFGKSFRSNGKLSYEGNFLNGAKNGIGTYYFKSGNKYEGMWKIDKRTGKGVHTRYYDEFFDELAGNFVDGKLNGKGTLTMFDKKDTNSGILVYSGDWVDGKMHGQGLQYFSKGKGRYEGGFFDGEFHGQGQAFLAGGDTYVGNWENGQRSGEGVYTAKDGMVYEGMWSNGLQHGKGSMTWPDGHKYIGVFFNGKREGEGILILPNGIEKRGSWKNDKFVDKSETPKDFKVPTEKQNKLYAASSGTGFYVSTAGHIITNSHVINNCKAVKVHTPGKIFNSIVISDDQLNDLALLKTEETPKKVFPFSVESPYLAQEIIVAGYPMVSTLGSNLKVTRGIISALSALGNSSNLQIDAAVQPGNSGGPIFDEYGNVIGVVVARLNDQEAQMVNFGIKASIAKNLLLSNNVNLIPSSDKKLNMRDFSKKMGQGTLLLTCWMTMEQIKKIQEKGDGKVLFKQYHK